MKIASLGLIVAFVAAWADAATTKHNQSNKPNILFIFTDDQDARLGSTEYMPNLQKYLVNEGTVHTNHFATVALCCPSRVSLLRGQYAHNTNITSVSPPYGGYNRFNTLGLGDDYLPLWIQKSGYSTHYIGKLMNEYAVTNYNSPKPAGFDYQDQLVDPYTYVYNTAVFSRDGEPPVFYNNTYQTDVVHAKALAALKAQRNADKPFFLWVAPMAPHGQFTYDMSTGRISTAPPIPAARHADMFRDVKIPRHPNFNPVNQTKTASYFKFFDHLSKEQEDDLDSAYRKRLQALQAVDEMIGSLFEELEAQGKLDNTYVFFSADNGYHLGQHRAYAGKSTNMEEDINVPLIVRGPGVPKGQVNKAPSAHHDLAPTFVALAEGDQHLPEWVDGGVIPVTLTLRKHNKPASKESFAVEYWGSRLQQFLPDDAATGYNTYKTLRVISEEYNLKYAVWCAGEYELYDLDKDPYELNNIFGLSSVPAGLLDRLDALLNVLKSCRGPTCRDPWRVLHPGNHEVQTLSDALDEHYDGYYQRFRHVAYKECLDYLDSANELVTDFREQLYDIAVSQHAFVADTKDSTISRRDAACERQQYTEVPTEEVRRLFGLIPIPTHHVGHHVPSAEELDAHASAIPGELLQTPVDWVKYGFYSRIGN